MPPAIAAASRASLKLVKTEHWRREHLQQLITVFKQGCKQLGLTLLPSDTAIQPVMVGDELMATKVSNKLAQLGMQVKAIRAPTVPKNQARLRVTLTAGHSFNDIEQLLAALSQTLKEINIEYPL
jgi:8-amino-7-oxononanoate synthase